MNQEKSNNARQKKVIEAWNIKILKIKIWDILKGWFILKYLS